jgi:DNA-binding IclR family transcriptional regulator
MLTRTSQKDPSRRARRQLSEASKKSRPATERALLLLEALAAIGRPATLKELAAAQEIPQATAFRLCHRMEREGYLVREAGVRRYAIGVRLMRLGLDIVRASGPTSTRRQILSDLVATIGETCNLTTLAGNDVLYLDRVETRWPLRLTLEPGSRVPVHCTASGKLFLAMMPEAQREQLLATVTLSASTSRTIVEKAVLRRELQRIARRGYSTDDEEFLIGLTAVAAPVLDKNGQVLAAVACHAPNARVTLKQLIAQIGTLKTAAARITRTFEITEAPSPTP